MNTLAGYTDSNAIDYLDDVRKYVAQNRAGRTAAANLTPEYTIPTISDLTVGDAVALDSNKQTPSDSLTVGDAVTRTDQATGTFVIDTAQIDFSDVA